MKNYFLTYILVFLAKLTLVTGSPTTRKKMLNDFTASYAI